MPKERGNWVMAGMNQRTMFSRRTTYFSFAITLLSILPGTRQQCGGICGGSIEVNVTEFGSVVIPCGNVVPSNNTRVNYCNETSNSPLAISTDVPYNLTEAQIHQNGNTLYCAIDTKSIIYCYKLNVFYAPYVPSDYRPIAVGPENIFRHVYVRCPLISNPPPVCNWSKYDDNNTRQEVLIGNSSSFSDGASHCSIVFFPILEIHSGLYECTALNGIGTTTYEFPERFNLENCFQLSLVFPVVALKQHSSNLITGDSATLKCRISSVSRYAALMWTVDNVIYNTSGTFNTSRGQIVLSYSAFNSIPSCSKSSNLTILDVSMDSEGIYICTAIQNNFVVKRNVSLVVSSNTQTSSSSSGSATVIGGAITGATLFLLVLTGLTVVAFVFYHHRKTVQHRNLLHESVCNPNSEVKGDFVNCNNNFDDLTIK